jgi:hypothetical protein
MDRHGSPHAFPLSDIAEENLSIPTVEQLVRLSTSDLESLGIAGISLVCANGLAGAEELDIPVCIARVRQWANRVRERLPRFASAFSRDPEYFNHSRNVFLMTIVVQVLKQDIGLCYNPERLPTTEVRPAPPDSRDLLIHGPLGPSLVGTCNNIPMVVVAVARELGYPVYLATTPLHVYAKWFEPGGEEFNIEASNPAGMVSHPDTYYRDRPPVIPEALLQSGSYLRPLTAAEELALCLVSRGWVLEAHGRYAEAAWAHEHACRLAPTEPMYPRIAARCVGRWMREVYNARVPEPQRIRSEGLYRHDDLLLDPRTLFVGEHLQLASAILARYLQIQIKATPVDVQLLDSQPLILGPAVPPADRSCQKESGPCESAN